MYHIVIPKREKRKLNQNDIGLIILIAFIFFIVFINYANAKERSFYPTITDMSGEIKMTTTYELDRNTFNGNGRKTSDLFISEEVQYGIKGFVYHPRFLVYKLSVSGGLKQEHVDTEEEKKWHLGVLKEYDFRTLILPEHPYNLELFSRRKNPFLKGRYTAGLNPVTYQHGANLYYHIPSLALQLGYGIDKLHSGTERSNTEYLRFTGSHVHNPFSTRLTVEGSKSKSTSVSKSRTLNVYFYNDVVKRMFSFISTAGLRRYEQDFSDYDFTDKNINWKERLKLRPFKNLRVNAEYNLYKTTRKRSNELSSDKDVTYGGGLFYKLYRSLTINYDLTKSEITSDSSSSDILTHLLTLHYRKRIPRGILYINFEGRNSRTERKGAIKKISEEHNATLLSPLDKFTLDQTNIDVKSIVVWVVEPPTGNLFELTRDVHYRLKIIGNQVEVQIISIDGLSPFIHGPGPFVFRIDYSLIPQDNVFDTKTYGYGIRLSLLDDLLSPYYQYSKTTQNVKKGQIPGGPESSTTNIIGLTINIKPYSFGIEHQRIKSRLNPQKRWLGFAIYSKQITKVTNLNVRLNYEKTLYEEVADRPGFSEVIYSISSRANFVFPKKATTAYTGINASYRKSITKTYGTGFNSGIFMSIGLLKLNAGLSFTYYLGKLETGDLKRDNLFFYFKASRKFY